MELTIKVPFVDEIVAHVKRHKTKYITGTVIVVTAGVTYLVLRQFAESEEASSKVSLSVSGKNHTLNHVTLIASNRQGPPSWVVRCLESDEVFTSQRTAAMLHDVNEVTMSRHLNGALPNAGGLHFERICMAA